MTRKKIFLIALGLAAGVLLLVVLFRPDKEKQIPSLLGRPLGFDAALIEQTWKSIGAQGEPARTFLRDRVNRFFPDQAVNCRVKYGGVSYQALLAPAGSRIELELDAQKGERMIFSPFALQPGLLTFLVKTVLSGKEEILFSITPRERIGKVERVFLPPAGGKKVHLLLETRGQGIGAWLNPCLLHDHPRPRTVLILMLDTLRADHVSAYGYKRRTTPALDELARGSLLFSRAFSTSSWTLPAHVSLFSGRDVLGHGVVSPESLIPADLPLLAETMQADGFVTLALTGGGFVDEHYGFFRGFQSYNSRSDEVFQREAAGLLYGSFMEDAANFAGQDLFVFLHTYQMHAPYKAPESYFRAFNPRLDAGSLVVSDDLRTLHKGIPALPPAAAEERQKLIDLYDASIFYSDQELLKPVLAYLRASKRFDDALLVVLADHGEEFYDHGDWEHGHTLYPELTRIPLVMKLPRQKNGEIRGQLVCISDIPGLIKAPYGLADDAGHSGNDVRTDAQRMLELSLPVSPFHSGLFGKVSFVRNQHQYIHNFLPPLTAAKGISPQPCPSSDEWFALADTPMGPDKPYFPPMAFQSRYRKMLANYILRLKALKKNIHRLDPELMEKLKALGYLNN
ncbi:MAG: sulfatase [Candidatus Aminicenantes bacterium]|nr:sulfatase [Candidatus Aminicenantes bacterium]